MSFLLSLSNFLFNINYKLLISLFYFILSFLFSIKDWWFSWWTWRISILLKFLLSRYLYLIFNIFILVLLRSIFILTIVILWVRSLWSFSDLHIFLYFLLNKLLQMMLKIINEVILKLLLIPCYVLLIFIKLWRALALWSSFMIFPFLIFTCKAFINNIFVHISTIQVILMLVIYKWIRIIRLRLIRDSCLLLIEYLPRVIIDVSIKIIISHIIHFLLLPIIEHLNMLSYRRLILIIFLKLA